LFVAGALAAIGDISLLPLMASLVVAAVLGNSLNYAIGRWFGHRILAWNSRLLNRAALEKTHAFFEIHGGKTLVISRFLPLLRTFAPFVAGMGEMGYARFTLFNLVGGIAWVVTLCLAGFWFGNLPLIKNNLSAVVVGIIVVSLLPAIIGYLKARKAGSS
ncbi:MAG TPA: VTT domain-containing protein, partial [Azospira sp.]|nr:VTT domain-containing protein [Azospira sp.]